MSKQLIVIRGIPGSGKSDLAKKLASEVDGAAIASVDQYFERHGPYKFQLSGVTHSYGFVKGQVDAYMRQERPLVIADGVHSSEIDIQEYIGMANKYGYQLDIKYPDTPTAFDPDICYQYSVHKVPLHTIRAMARQFERILQPVAA